MNHLDPHFNDELASEWRYQCFDSLRLRLRWAFLLNGCLLILLGLSLCLLICLFPLKQTLPFVISLNETTGEMTQLGELNPTSFDNHWAVTRFFILRYLQNRESYHADNLERPYQIAYAMSDKVLAEQYALESSTQNPNSPSQRYRQEKYVTVTVQSIAKLNDNTAEVHFEKVLQDKITGTQGRMPMVAIVKWEYRTQKVTQKMLDRNPMGFTVTYYHPTPVTLRQEK